MKINKLSFLLSLALLLIMKLGYSQVPTNVTLHSFSAPQQSLNPTGEYVVLSPNSTTTFYSGIYLSRNNFPEFLSRPLKCQVLLYLTDDLGNNLMKIADTLVVTSNDFSGKSSISNLLNIGIKIPHGLVSDYGQRVYIKGKSRYYKDNYPWPDNVNGWTDWYLVTRSIPCGQLPPTSIITGPSSICTEAIYTITNPYTVSLVNANGLATLTPLAGNQWKITRTGTGTGIIKLRSMVNGQAFDKEIKVGLITSGSITGAASLQLGESQTFTLPLSDNTDYKWTVSYNPNVILTKNSPTSITLSTTGSVPMGWSESIIIRATAMSDCGLASNSVEKTIKFVNEREPRID